MIKLNNYIIEAWSGVKKQANKADIEAWCEEMGVKKYTINSKGEIDVDGSVWTLKNKNFKELPYKFGTVTGFFNLDYCKNLISLKNCPNEVEGYFSCDCCYKLDSLEGCPQKVGGEFSCRGCKREFTKEYVKSLCEIKDKIYIEF